jgi:hypothetical protein
MKQIRFLNVRTFAKSISTNFGFLFFLLDTGPEHDLQDLVYLFWTGSIRIRDDDETNTFFIGTNIGQS